MNRTIQKAFRGVTLLASFAILALGLNVAHAKNIKKQNLLDLMTHTDSILIGTVSGKTDGFYKGLPYTEITLEVAQSLRGAHGSTYSFRQFGLIEPKSMGNGLVNLMVTPAGWPTYAKGEQVMLFLHKPASETGFQTTAGLTQGKFTIKGKEIANGIGNDSLFAGVKINGALSPVQQDLRALRTGTDLHSGPTTTPWSRVRYELKTPWRNGTTHVIFEPLDFMFRTNGMPRAQEAQERPYPG